MGRDVLSGRVHPTDQGGGILLTEYVATAALQGIIAANGSKGIDAEIAATQAVAYAEAMVRLLKNCANK